MLEPTPEEQSKVEQILELMGGGVDDVTALRVLRKRAGNLERAINDVLEGNVGTEGPLPALVPVGWHTPSETLHPPSPTNADIIDLTRDEEMEGPDMSKALEESLRDHIPSLGSSSRAVVPYNPNNAVGAGMSHDDQEMSRAIEASMSATYGVEEEPPLIPNECLLRKDARPVAPRASSQLLCYAVLAAHALLYIPQLREALMQWMPPSDFHNEEDKATWALLRTFVLLDVSVIHGLEFDEYVQHMGAVPASGPNEDEGVLATSFLTRLMRHVQKVLHLSEETDPLMRAKYEDFEHFFQDPIVRLPIWEANPQQPPDLISALLSEFMRQPMDDPPDDYYIARPKEIVMIQLQRTAAYEGGARGAEKGERTRFTYPPSLYIDPFLLELKDVTTLKREQHKKLEKEIEELQQRKRALTSLGNKDVLKDLRASIHYYEHVARDFGEAARKEILASTAEKLRDVLAKLESELKAISEEISRIKLEMAGLFSTPELQNYKYDLRAVLFSDGFFGRQHIYSYVKDGGRWWKTLDYAVEEVSEETVLTDPTGLHLNAGAFLLIYSRSLTPEIIEEIDKPKWIERVAEPVVENNQSYLAQIPPEEADKAYIKLDLPILNNPDERASQPAVMPARETRRGALNSQSQDRMDVA